MPLLLLIAVIAFAIGFVCGEYWGTYTTIESWLKRRRLMTSEQADERFEREMKEKGLLK